MSSQPSFLAWLRHPGSIVLLIAVVLMLVIMMEQKGQQAASPLTSGSDAATKSVTKPGTMGGELPRIVRQFSAPSAPSAPITGGQKKPGAAGGSLQAPDLGSLLGRLEDKVKAEPANIGNRLLLAQTYNELGLADKALQEARAARKQDPAHARAKLVLASILSGRDNTDGLNEAKGLLEELSSSSDIKQYLVAMYLGDTYIRLGNHEAASSHWQQAVNAMPASDNRRQAIEKRIQSLSTKATQ